MLTEAASLALTLSPKSRLIPDTATTRAVASQLRAEGVPVKTAKKGEDIGVDTTAANSRCTARLATRVRAAGRRAKRAALLTRLDPRSKRLGPTGVAPAQQFGQTATGMRTLNANHSS